ncbi:hypothetical protein [Cellulosimicrobium cellulans]|uniref:hypothetical protein n=1 Tax=Cellulosimicrobium cellulans TaxID=1710 RepID=UPI000848F9A1|nr:hypothetical protein [Cellulosimicrobium cellulans]
MDRAEPFPAEDSRLVLAADVPRPVLVAGIADGTAHRVRRGADLLGTVPAAARPTPQQSRAAALARIEAVSRQLEGVHRFCGPSAALLWGLPLWRLPRQVHVVQRNVPGRGAGTDLVRHRAAVAPDETGSVGGLPATTLTRTVLDCVRSLPAREGLVVADGAVRRGLDPEELRRRAASTRGRGVVRARAVLDAVDGGAESPGESITRYAILRHGLPAPRTQVPVVTRLGRFRADMGWEEWRVLVEFDGFVKYSDLAGGDPARVLFEEKRRQEAIEEEGWRVLRVTRADLHDEEQVATRVRRLLPRDAATRHVSRPGLW